ncbi:homoserine kinase [Fusobacterium sp.]|uniref:homoserine kinase n=1 Tax=Fusobacterium sp. TaxID=68766 RepID=UPI00396C512A
MAVYTDLKEKDLNIILEKYNLKLINYNKIKNGILNTNYFLNTDSGKYVLRVFEGGRKFEEENLELNFLLSLKNIIPCCTPLKTPDNKNYIVYNNKMVALFYFIAGEPIDEIDESIISQIGYHIGKLHSYSIRKKLNRASRIDMDFYYKNIDFEKLEIAKEDKIKIKNTYNKVKEKSYVLLPSGIIHNDIFPDNVFITDGKIIGILDFNESQTGPLIFDLAIIINYWINIKNFSKGKKKKFIDIFLDEYEKERKLTEEEKKMLPHAVLKMAVTFILLRLYKFNVENNSECLIEDKNYKQLMPLLEN